MQECMIGIVFAEEAEAKTFYKKVNNRKAEKCLYLSPTFIFMLVDIFS